MKKIRTMIIFERYSKYGNIDLLRKHYFAKVIMKFLIFSEGKRSTKMYEFKSKPTKSFLGLTEIFKRKFIYVR